MPVGEIVHPSSTEQTFLLNSLQTAALRPDGRKFFQARPISVEFGERLGWCQVQMGDTMYV